MGARTALAQKMCLGLIMFTFAGVVENIIIIVAVLARVVLLHACRDRARFESNVGRTAAGRKNNVIL